MERVTNDERRRIAERLRCVKLTDGYIECELRYALDETYACAASNCVECLRYVFDRLADMIDLGGEIAGKVCELEGIGEGELCSPIVDIDALLALADEMETYGVDRYTVSTQYVCDQYARRIREAVGE